MVFSIPSYLCLGDRPKRVVDERAKGMTFLVSRPKTGKGNDAFIDKGEYINKYHWNGERGCSNYETVRRRDMMESAKKNMTPNGFVFVGPTKKGEGLGSYFGCFQSTPYPHIPSNPEKQVDRIARARALAGKDGGEEGGGASASPSRGIYTSPAKKGTGYGYAGLAISDIGAEYIATFYDAPQRAARADRLKWAQKMPAEPFKPVGRRGYTFDEALATGTSRCYIMTAPFKEKKPAKVVPHFFVAAPWRPAGCVHDTSRVIEYWEDPYGGYDPRVDPKSLIKKPTDEPFKPSSCSDSFWYTQSIVFKRV